MPKIQGVFETALYVDDVERSRAFYQELFGFEPFALDGRICALRVPNGAAYQVLLIFKKGGTPVDIQTPGGVIPKHDGAGQLHMAFQVSDEEYGDWKNELEKRGVAIESEVQFGSARSLYFRDLDNHLIELATPGIWEEIVKAFTARDEG